MKIKKGDTIQVIAGKDKGRTGKVERAYPKSEKILVENINMYKKHMQKSEKLPKGGVVDVPRPLTISNVMFMCPKCKKPSRIGYAIKDAKKHRVCKKCNKVV
ncbi:MAG: 50S ribosomal protein L24 [Candidatus Roizmanbacteria bacterium GW2011_GWA2_37_7]|uniref:Large ribosomal subunit protein uL24 n=1 Tax=Candidatus Roizmanbacteria bacterium GW2011_GWA2_37_7 TaxID=1618481 RepID=A0A0G0KCL0_9BACT|nr:MAG: 50S ribosomal protein L24 [Candidatus Roizmanbacteria bacterium GW2011_GWA2_37_7]